MKPRIFASLALVLLLASSAALAQYGQLQDINRVPSHFYTRVFTAKTYANNQLDTSATFNVGGTRLLDLQITYNDSTNVLTRVEKRTNPSGSWTFTIGDTLNQTGGGVVSTSTVRTVTVRDATTDRLGGAGAQIRIIQVFQATINGVTTPTYSLLLRWKP